MARVRKRQTRAAGLARHARLFSLALFAVIAVFVLAAPTESAFAQSDTGGSGGGGSSEQPPPGSPILGQFMGDDCASNVGGGDFGSPTDPSRMYACTYGRFPSDHYDIGYDEGAWNHLGRKLVGALTDIIFGINRTLIAAGLWLLKWAYSFELMGPFKTVADTLSTIYTTEIVGERLQLGHIALFVAAVYGGVQLLKGRMAKGFGEVVASLIIFGIGLVFLADPAKYLDSGFQTVGKISGALLSAGSGEAGGGGAGGAAADGYTPGDKDDWAHYMSWKCVPRTDRPAGSQDYSDMACPILARVHSAFIEEPHELINWGTPLRGNCAQMRDLALATGPWGPADAPRKAMNDHDGDLKKALKERFGWTGDLAQCGPKDDDIGDDLEEFNKNPTTERMVGALLTTIVGLIAVVMLIIASGIVVLAQLQAMIYIAMSPLAFVGGILPGNGRMIFFQWIAGFLKSLLAVIGMSLFLSIVTHSVTGLLSATAGSSLMERFALLVLVMGALFGLWKKIHSAGQNVGQAIAQGAAATTGTGQNGGSWFARPDGQLTMGVAGLGLQSWQKTRAGQYTSGAIQSHRNNARLGKYNAGIDPETGQHVGRRKAGAKRAEMNEAARLERANTHKWQEDMVKSNYATARNTGGTMANTYQAAEGISQLVQALDQLTQAAQRAAGSAHQAGGGGGGGDGWAKPASRRAAIEAESWEVSDSRRLPPTRAPKPIGTGWQRPPRELGPGE